MHHAKVTGVLDGIWLSKAICALGGAVKIAQGRWIVHNLQRCDPPRIPSSCGALYSRNPMSSPEIHLTHTSPEERDLVKLVQKLVVLLRASRV